MEASTIAAWGLEVFFMIMQEYGQAIGLAFQISDDLLDVTGDPALMGKSSGKDAVTGKATVVARIGLEKSRTLIDNLEKGATEVLKPFGEAASTLIEAARFITHREH